MKAFTFFNPTKIEFGKGKENNIGQYIKEYGYKKVLIVYGSERIKRDGLFNCITNSLKKNEIQFVEVGGIVSNPLLSKVYKAINVARESKVDSILAVGGGSVLDSVKTIAAGVKYDGDVWDFYEGKAAIQDALPLFSIMTLAVEGINKLEAWFKKIGTPVSLEEANIPREEISNIAENAYGFATLLGIDALYPQETIAEILELA